MCQVKPQCLKPPGHNLCTPEPGRLGCVISKQKGVNGDASPVAISQKATKNLPVSFYSPTLGFKHILFQKKKKDRAKVIQRYDCPLLLKLLNFT